MCISSTCILIISTAFYFYPPLLNLSNIDQSKEFQTIKLQVFGWICWIFVPTFIYGGFGLINNKLTRCLFQITSILSGLIWLTIVILYAKFGRSICQINTTTDFDISQQDAVAIDIWLFAKKLSPDFIPNLEVEYECCGWFNVFDHCTSINRQARVYHENSVTKQKGQNRT